MHPFINTAIKAARKAGEIVTRAESTREHLAVDVKSKNNFVTSVDRAAEQEIIAILRNAYPHHGILAEEAGESQHSDQDEYQWIIDPLDGTTNFIHGYPHYCISIALKYRNRIEHGVVYDLIQQDIYTASRGAGALKNDRRIRVTKTVALGNAMFATGLPASAAEFRQDFFKILYQLSSHARSIRLAGAAALDLAYVAAGQLDAYWSMHLAPWDLAAGTLLVREAGGHCMDLEGRDDFLKSGHIVAGNVKIVKALLEYIQPHMHKAPLKP